MAYKMFASIHVGSEDVSLRIYEISRKNGIRRIDDVKYFIELGSDTYRKGYIEFDLVHELCQVLEQFKLKMKEYRITDYIAYASSAVREALNAGLIIDQIRVRTGLKIQCIDNSEQCFLQMKAIAQNMGKFRQLVQEGAVIVDMGAGSLQLTVYDEGRLIFTQNLKLGSLRLREILADLEEQATDFVKVMEDYIGNDIDTFNKLFMNTHKMRHIIVMGEEMMSMLKLSGSQHKVLTLNKTDFARIYDMVLGSTPDALSVSYSMPYEIATLLKPAAVVYQRLIAASGAEKIWAGEADLCDGMAVEYAEKLLNIQQGQLFNEDIIAYGMAIAGKYDSNIAHIENVEKLSTAIFDALRKKTGLSDRDRLLLRMACILHDSGKFINMQGGTDHSYFIVLATEFIGLSVEEKKIIADVIKYNSAAEVPAREDLAAPLGDEAYIRMLKLTAILRIANGMDQSHTQKMKKVSVQIRDDMLMIKADTLFDITLEQTIMDQKGVFFEEIYGYKPVLRAKRR